MSRGIMRVFSGSHMSLDDIDSSMPRLVKRAHVLGSGEDLFDQTGRPHQPQPRTLTKVFSGSALDLNAQVETDSADASHGVSPAVVPADQRRGVTQSFNDFVDNVDHRGPASGANARTTVLVIGGSGYLASHVIEQLLRAGYQVRATVPDMRDSAKLHDLYNMVPEAKHMLYVVEADVFNAPSLRNAMGGCRYVMHCGVPSAAGNGGDVVTCHMDAVMALFDAVRTTDMARGRRIERIVLTGSYTNVLSGTASKSGKYDESQWNEVAKRESDPLTYARVYLEREATRLARLSRIELVVILPAIMIGPTRTMEVSEAMRTITDFALCSPYFPVAPNIYWNFVDVRDVAAAHVKAMTASNVAGQRLLVTNTNLRLAALGKHIRDQFPHLTAPVYTAPTILSLFMAPWTQGKAHLSYLWRVLGVRRELDGSAAKETLGLSLTPMEVTVADAVSSLIADGHLPGAPGTAADGGEGQPSQVAVSKPQTFTTSRLAIVVGAVGCGVVAWMRLRQGANRT